MNLQAHFPLILTFSLREKECVWRISEDSCAWYFMHAAIDKANADKDRDVDVHGQLDLRTRVPWVPWYG